MTDRATLTPESPVGVQIPVPLTNAVAMTFSGKSEVARRARAIDWASTPLGPVDAWPQSLRSAIDQCLHSGFASYVFWGPDLVQIYNDAAIEILQDRHPSGLGRPVADVWGDIWPTIKPLFDRVRQNDEVFRADEMPVIPEGGTEGDARYYTFCYSPLHDETGAVAGVYCVAIESTRSVRAEAAVRRSEGQYRALLRHFPDGAVLLVDQELRIQVADGESLRVAGYDPEALIGRQLREVLSSADADVVEPMYRAALSGESRDFLFQSAGRMYECHATPVQLPGGAVGAMVLTQDATERRKALEHVEESERRFRAIFDGAGIGIALVDLEGRPIRTNAALQRMLGHTDAELCANPFTAITHPDDRAIDWGLFKELIESTRDAYEIEKRYLRKDGAIVWGRLTCTLIRGGLGEPQLAVGMVQDITGVKTAEASLRASDAQLQQAQKMESVGRLAGGIAHDFNNLLAVISGNLNFALADIGSDSPLRADLVAADEAATRAASLTRQLLAFSRKQILAPEVLDLNAVVAKVVPMLKRLIGEHIEVTVRADDGLYHVLADPGQLEQVMVNLAINARDAMPHGGHLRFETQNITSGVASTSGGEGPAAVLVPHARLTVTDTGTGMDETLQAQIFEPFFSTKPLGQGTGLGLSMVHGIVQQSGGSISVTSAPGRGASFVIDLPAIPQQQRDGAHRPITSGGSEDKRGVGTILLVEDEPGVRTFARRVLVRAGYDVLEASNGAKALALAAARVTPVDLLVCDVVMPGAGGREVAEAIVARWPATSVLFISGYTDDDILRHGVQMAAVSFLAKPFTAEQLREAVFAALGR